MAGTPWEWWFPDGRAARRQHGAPRRLRGDGHGGGVLRNTLLRVGRRRCSTTCRMTPCSCWMRTSTRRRKATLPKSPGDTNRSAMTWSGRSFRPMLSTCGPGISRAHQTLRTSQDRSRRSTPSPPRGFRRKRLAGTGRQPPRPDPAARLRSFVGNAETRTLLQPSMEIRANLFGDDLAVYLDGTAGWRLDARTQTHERGVLGGVA